MELNPLMSGLGSLNTSSREARLSLDTLKPGTSYQCKINIPTGPVPREWGGATMD